MSFARTVFVVAFLMLVAGFVGSRFIAAYLFGAPPEPTVAVLAASHSRPTATLHPTVRVTAVPTTPPTVQPTSRPAATSALTQTTTIATAKAVSVASSRHHPSRVKPTPTTAPRPTATTGIVTLARYWVGTLRARPGQTIEVGYVIDNQTGHTARISLGASIKGSHYLSWGTSVSDPSHDVVAIAAPGVTTHVRFFTLPTGLSRGVYDVAWGLRDPVTGAREALVAAPGVLRVRG